MGILTTILLALGMSVDAFAAALARGAGCHKECWRDMLKIALIFGIVETIAPLLGWLVGSMTQQFIAEYDHWLAFILLAILGIKMIWGAFHDDDDNHVPTHQTSLLLSITTAIATSIDSMVVGVGLAFLDANIWLTALTIGASTTIMAAIGLQLGRVLGKRAGSRAEIVGGLVLIGIGLSILAEHLNWF